MGPTGGPFTIVFDNVLANTNVAMTSSFGVGDSASLATTYGFGNELQTVDLGATALNLGGTFQLSFGGQTTGAISATATAAQVQAALAALSTIGPNNVEVTNGSSSSTASSGGVYAVIFTGGWPTRTCR